MKTNLPIIQRSFTLPRHPDDAHIPDSIINIYLGPGRIITIQGPLFSKTMKMLCEVLPLWKDFLVAKEPAAPDYEI